MVKINSGAFSTLGILISLAGMTCRADLLIFSDEPQ